MTGYALTFECGCAYEPPTEPWSRAVADALEEVGIVATTRVFCSECGRLVRVVKAEWRP